MSQKSNSSPNMADQGMWYGQDEDLSKTFSSISLPGKATSSSKDGNANQEPVAEQGAHYPPTTSGSYVYPGYDRDHPKWEVEGNFSSQGRTEEPYSDIHMENSSPLYHMPGYSTYAPGQLMAVNGPCLSQHPYLSSAGHPEHTTSYESETMHIYLCDLKPAVRDSMREDKIPDESKTNASELSPATPLNSNGLTSANSKSYVEGKVSAKPSELKPCLSASLSDPPGEVPKLLNKVSQPSSIQPLGAMRHDNNSEQMSSLSYKGQGGPRNRLANSRSTGQDINNTNQLKKNEKDKLSNNLALSSELVRGPRANKMGISSSSYAGKDNVNCFIRRDQYNKSVFQIKYEQAKFFMIKSYSEDDVHKSIKYSVWSSTAYGNKKLEAAFHDAEMQTKDKGTKCPIFLFFSVNTSGQFVGLAEMIAPVDFTKNMDFWQRDKWNGFFPVTWHIIKDIPNNLFHNITLENNDNRPVTFSRDTQEIGFPQGLKMLHIFKGYTSETSLLDDFDFYESREKSLRATRSSRPVKAHSELEFNAGGFPMKHLESAVRKMSVSARTGRPDDFRSSPTAHSRNSSRNNRLEAKRYQDAS